MKRIIIFLIIGLSPLFSLLPQEHDRDSLDVTYYLSKAKEFFYDDYLKAYEYAREGLLKADPDKQPLNRIRLLQITAEIEYFYLNEFSKSISHLNEMRTLSDNIDYKRGIPWFNLNLANLYHCYRTTSTQT